MKRLFYIILSVVLFVGATSCTELLDPSVREIAQQIPNDAKVTLYFGTPAEVETKAEMASDPTIESIHVFVFNKEGILVETAEADAFGKVTSNGPDGAKHWKVTLTMAGEERRLHFIANLPKDNGAYLLPESGSESSIFQSLATDYPEAAYWQRRILSLGIHAYQYDGSKEYQHVDDAGVLIKETVPHLTDPDQGEFWGGEGNWSYRDTKGREVNKDDYIDRSGCKIVDGTGLYAIEEVVEKIPMVRNFARFSVRSTWTRVINNSTQSFTLTRAALVNKPAAGFIAPYDNVANSFVSEYIGLSGNATPVIDHLSGYSINLPGAGIDESEPKEVNANNESDFTPADQAGIVTLFCYERAKPTSKPICILLAGKWTSDGSEVWYKIELSEADGSYFPIYRDFTYDVNITSIEDNDGYPTSTAAFNAAAVGDFCSSPETATLEQISDDNGLTLWVNYIDYTAINADLVQTGDLYVTLLYTCFRQKEGYDTKYFNDLVKFTRQNHPDYATLPYATEDPNGAGITPSGYPRAVTADDDVTPPDHEGLTWYITKIKLKTIGEQQGYLRSQIHVEADVPASRNQFDDEDNGYAKKLFRDVTYTVMPKLDMVLATTGITAASGQTTTLTITLPNTLTKSLFPLTLKIEAENNCLTPAALTTAQQSQYEKVSVDSGTSAFNADKNSFYYLLTIDYSDYYDDISKQIKKKDFLCRFTTTKSSGNVPTKIRVTDVGKYFNIAEVALTTTDSTGGTVN